MSDDASKVKYSKRKSNVRKLLKPRVAEVGMSTEAMNDCLGTLRQYRKKSRVFRQRVLDFKSANRITKVRIIREIVKILGEMEDGARLASETLKARLPVNQPLMQAEISDYIAGRLAREAGDTRGPLARE